MVQVTAGTEEVDGVDDACEVKSAVRKLEKGQTSGKGKGPNQQ